MYLHRMALCTLGTLAGSAILGLSLPTAAAADSSSYQAVRDVLLSVNIKPVELTGENGERVMICPDLQGRVMTSTCNDLEGRSLGWVNQAFIKSGAKDPHFNNYGGEDRLWLGPEGGPYSLWFAPGAEQKLANWNTPAALNDGPFKVVSKENEPYFRLNRSMQLQNAARTQFTLEVSREIHLQKTHHFGELFGKEAQSALEAAKLKMVGFQTINTVTNRGPGMTREKGLISIWSLGQFPATPRTYIIAPFKTGLESDLGPVVNSDYFGDVPSDRLRLSSQAIFFTGDGKFRSKIGVSQHRAKNVAGAIDLQQGLLTLVHFSMPQDPTAYSYVNNTWGRQAQPFQGDVFNSYNDGPPEPGKPAMGGFFELESLSPAVMLPTGKSLGHKQSTFHIEGDANSLARIVKAALGIDISVQEVASEKSKR